MADEQAIYDDDDEPCLQCRDPMLKGIHTCGIDEDEIERELEEIERDVAAQDLEKRLGLKLGDLVVGIAPTGSPFVEVVRATGNVPAGGVIVMRVPVSTGVSEFAPEAACAAAVQESLRSSAHAMAFQPLVIAVAVELARSRGEAAALRAELAAVRDEVERLRVLMS